MRGGERSRHRTGLSASDSLLAGKNTANFAESAVCAAMSSRVETQIQRLAAQFPTRNIRVFFGRYQGAPRAEQGCSHLQSRRHLLRSHPMCGRHGASTRLELDGALSRPVMLGNVAPGHTLPHPACRTQSSGRATSDAARLSAGRCRRRRRVGGWPRHPSDRPSSRPPNRSSAFSCLPMILRRAPMPRTRRVWRRRSRRCRGRHRRSPQRHRRRPRRQQGRGKS